MTPKDLNQRDQEILNLLISEYISSAMPVGSKVLSERFGSKLSSASVRNVLADLEEHGYLTHPHTSAGRMPTEKGFRYYVDSLLAMRNPSEREIELIRAKFEGTEPGVNSLLNRTSTILSSLSHYASLVMIPGLSESIFKYMEFLPLSRGRLLGISVTKDGVVQNRVVEIGEELNYSDLEKINNYCNKVFYGLTLADACKKVSTELVEAEAAYDKLLTKALIMSKEVLSARPDGELIIDGEARLLETPEFDDIDKVRQLMGMLEEKRMMLKVLERTMEAGEIQIFVGSESHFKGIDFCSVVAAPYKRGKDLLGIVGVIGPKRMDYSRAISVVDCTSQLLSELLENGA